MEFYRYVFNKYKKKVFGKQLYNTSLQRLPSQHGENSEVSESQHN